MSTTNKKDQLIDELIAITQTKKAEIEKAEKPTWNTNCLFSYDNVSSKTNIRTVSKVDELVQIMAYIIGKFQNFEEANALLGTKETFEYAGFSKADWISDLKTRVSQISIAAKRKELEGIEAQLDGLISKERREELQLQALELLLKGSK